MLTILLTRHGHTDRSEPEQYLGQHLPATLSARGRKDARALARRLATVPIDRVLTSPLGRAVETASLLVHGRAINVELDERLTELDYGAWEGHPLDEIIRLFPGEYEEYERDPATHHVGGGESGYEVVARLAPFFDELVGWAEEGKAGAQRTALVVGHSSVNRIALAMLLGGNLNDYRRRFDQDWANLTVLRWPDRASGARLLLSNDLAHARGIKGVTWG
ncbi:MAG: histidine phosphatase family protein [Chloroflexota bacterium]